MNVDHRIIITDNKQVITAENFWDPKLVVMAKVPDGEIQKQSLKHYKKSYKARVIWTYDEKIISAVMIPNEQDLTLFMLAHTELYHFKQKFWENHSRDFLAEIEEDIESARNNLLEAESNKRLFETKGPVAYRKHVEKLYGVRSTILKSLLRHNKTLGVFKKTTKP